MECPVCLEAIEQPQFPFECGHHLCRNCSRRMSQTDLHRCPTCRAPRVGMTAAQAAPREEPVQEALPYAGLFRWVSHNSAFQPPPPQGTPPQPLASPMAEDFAAALLMLQQQEDARVPVDPSFFDEETRSDLQALAELPLSIAEWRRRRSAERDQRAAVVERARALRADPAAAWAAARAMATAALPAAAPPEEVRIGIGNLRSAHTGRRL